MKEPTEIWIVEDERELRDSLATLINLSDDLSCKNTFGSYDAMLPLIRAKQFPQLMLVDIQLPGINGIEIIQKIRAQHVATQFIVLTISDNRKTVFEAICAGANGYLLKNDSFEKILEGIRLVLRGGSPLSGSIASMILDVHKQPALHLPDTELSDQEIRILELLAADLTKKEIASQVTLSIDTVSYHLRNIYRKLQVHSQSGAVAEAFRKGLIH
ncbi:MAG: response regulator transcription factor [Bdellovibrionaceae bacterium]|nr:response regulator transcription factor [Pseudobdellovibrionaceae bacterium]